MTIDTQLMEYFKFDQNDLYANQNGKFTDKQMAHVIQKDKQDRTGNRGSGVFLGCIGLLGIIIAIVAGIATPDWGFRIGFGLGFGVIWPLVWGGIGYMFVKDTVGKHEFKLARVEGRANIVRHESYNNDTHSSSVSFDLHIGGHTFDVAGDTADVIFQGESYAIYYVDSTDEIMSVEHL